MFGSGERSAGESVKDLLRGLRLRALICSICLICVIALAVLCVPVAKAQTLARPGWAGSGLTPNLWWRHAVVYAIDPHAAGGLKGVAARLDGMQALGVDAVLLRGMQSAAGAGLDAADAEAGTMDEFDAVLLEASRRSLRVLVELNPKTTSEDVTGVARFWLSRGVAGFRLTTDSTVQMRELRAAAKSYVGERVMIGSAALSSIAVPVGQTAVRSPNDLAGVSTPPPADTPRRSRRGRRRHSASSSSARSSQGRTAPSQSAGGPVRSGDGPQLLLDASIAVAPLNVAAIRTALEKNDAMNRVGAGVPMLATAEGAGGGPEFGKVVATLLLSTRGGAMIRAGQEGAEAGDLAPPSESMESLSAWYKRLSVMQHSNATIRTGVNAMLNHDEQSVVVWVRRPQNVSYNSPAVVTVCNMTNTPVTLSLRDDMQGLRLKGTFLRTLLRSDVAMGAMPLDRVTLAPYGVYVGELRY